MSRLRITEIFYSLQGETRSVGWPTAFVRLTGCPLRCHYCDTDYAFQGGTWMELEQVFATVAAFSARHVTVTGGEPLAQPACLEFLVRLCDAGYETSLETSGALDISAVDPRVIKIMDIKAPGSGEETRNSYANLNYLSPQDQIKLVLCDRDDYDWAKAALEHHRLAERCEVLLSPSYKQLNPTVLAEWILEDRLPVRMQIQLHKYLWGEEPGR
ncbi:MAG: 7-carboxy-7-deazaguanine synthase QueE [Candidatus Nitrosoglobus sp.]